MQILFFAVSMTSHVAFIFTFQVLPLLTNIEVINFGDCLVKTQGAKVLAEELTKGANNLKVNITNIVDLFKNLQILSMP